MSINAVFHICMQEKYVVQKLVARRICPNCGENYNIAHIMEGSVRMPALLPQKPGVCDKCGTKLMHRPDDVKDRIQERFAHYREKTDPLIAYYKATGRFFMVDGRPDASEVTRQIMEIIDGEVLDGEMAPVNRVGNTLA